jgi:hypothetical protein
MPKTSIFANVSFLFVGTLLTVSAVSDSALAMGGGGSVQINAPCGSVPHGTPEFRQRYHSNTVPSGGRCWAQRQSRTCNNGTFSKWNGTYAYAECRKERCGVGVCIVESEISVGQLFDVRFEPPPDRSFGWNFAIYRDTVSPQNFLTNPSLIAAQDSVPSGSPFVVTVDTLNWEPGLYVIRALNYTDTIEVLPRPASATERVSADMISGSRAFGLYSEEGDFLADDVDGDAIPVIDMGTVYVLAVDLNRFRNLRNRVDLRFFSPDGSELLSDKLLQVNLIEERSMGTMMTVHGICPAQPLDPSSYPGGIALAFFRTPAHQRHYEYDGQVRFRLRANPLGGPSLCAEQDIEVKAFLEDSPAAEALPSFEEYNAERYPGELDRNSYPLDTHHVRIVRFGGLGMTDPAALGAAARDIERYFSIATKGYFKLVVDGVETLPYDEPGNVLKVEQWYQSAPKTPGKPTLNLADPNELYLATLLYYYEHEDEFVQDFLALYPSRSHGEDLTIYWVDGPGALGRGMGNIGATRVKISRLYPGSLFYEGVGEDRTYHYDLASCADCGDATGEYLEFLSQVGGLDTFKNTTLHELGHVLWSGRSGFSVGDGKVRRLPFPSSNSVLDGSRGFFTRFEYMSYGRDRSVLDGMSYGDDFLGGLLRTYSEPEGSVQFRSHGPGGEADAVVKPGDNIIVLLDGQAGSGLSELSYRVIAAPVELSGFATAGDFGYDDRPRPPGRVVEEVTFSLETPGTYTYELIVRDRLYGEIPGHPHEYRQVFTIRVAGPGSD